MPWGEILFRGVCASLALDSAYLLRFHSPYLGLLHALKARRHPAVLVLLLALVGVPHPQALGETEPDAGDVREEQLPVEELANQLLEQIKGAKPDDLWGHVNRLVRLGQSFGRRVSDRLEVELKSRDEKLRLASARALCQLSTVDLAAPVLHALVLEGSTEEIRRLAANTLGLNPTTLFEDTATQAALKKALEKEAIPWVRMAIARSLWRLGGRDDARLELLQLLREAPEKAVGDEAALVLAEIGYLRPKDEWTGRTEEAVLREVFVRIITLALEPTERGLRAFTMYRFMEESAIRGQTSKYKSGEFLLRELLAYIKKAYPDQEVLKFALDPKLLDELKEKTVSERLRAAFKSNGIALSEKASLADLKDGQWLLSDLGKLFFQIRKDEQGFYQVYQERTNIDKLFENAGKGLVESLDPFSQYLDREEVQATQEMLRQDYGGIGAYVGERNRVFTVISPIYNSPADKAGLKSMDSILEVDGDKTDELMGKGGMAKVIAKLKGPPGSQVRVKFYRRGFAKPMEITIVRDNIKVDSVYHTLLPGAIGYIRLTRFGERTTEELDHALGELLKNSALPEAASGVDPARPGDPPRVPRGSAKARGLILDLRNNPGGLLRAGVEVADRFLGGNKLIVYSEGLKEFAPRKDFFSTGGREEEALPLVVLVNSGSASASEIVAGALQDHKRAPLVGEKTYGKGSVQQIIPLKATNLQTELRLTIAKYYLPLGRCIHEKGIEPEFKVEAEETDEWSYRKLYELNKQHLFEDYLRTRWNEHKALFLKLAEDDEGKAERYPDFEAFYKSVDPRIERGDVRAELRRVLRRMAQDELKCEYACDLESDDVLQRGVLELLEKLKLDPAAFAQYKGYPQKFAKKADASAEMGAMLPRENDHPAAP